MLRASTSSALALALTFGGAAMAQQASGTAKGSGDISPGVGAPASQGTDVKGIYSTKRTMGISTGRSASDADASSADEASAAAKEDGDAASE